MNGKGSNPRPFSSYKQYLSNFDEINWNKKGDYCFNCGQRIDKFSLTSQPWLYILHSDGSIEHKNNCNFN